jgi:adenylate cyclase
VRGRSSWRLTSVFLAAACLLGGWLGVNQLRGASSALDGAENLTLDWRFLLAGARPAPRGVVIAAIDDETLQETGGGAPSRKSLAGIVRRIAEFGPRAVALDIALVDPKDAETDAELADALKSTTSVVAAIGLFGEGRQSGARAEPGELALAPQPSGVLWPVDVIRDAALAGLANVSTDASGVPRYIPLIYPSPDGAAPSFALAAASSALGADPVFGPDSVQIGDRTTTTDLGYHMPLRYYGPAASFTRVSAAKLLSGAIEPELLRGQVVVVGMTAAGFGDTFATPFDRVAPGAEIFATAISNLLNGDALVRSRATRRLDGAAAVSLPVLMLALMSMRRPGAGFAAAGLVFVLWAGGVLLAFVHGYWFNMAAPLASTVPLVIGYAGARYIAERRATQRIEAEKLRLARFQSPLLLDHILRTPDFLKAPIRQNVAALFLDLSGFTSVAEGLGPEASRELLGDMQSLVEREVTAERGIVLNFMGDGVFAAFGLPEPKGDDAARALIAVERLRSTVAAWVADLPAGAKGRLDFRIGAHYGPAMISRQGSESQQQISATGDTVNVASRLLEVAKQQHCRVVVTEDLVAAADAQLPARSFDGDAFAPLTVAIRGRASPLKVRMRK